MTKADLLHDLLDLARREDLLEGENLEAFVRALRERASLILDERVRTAEVDNAWRKEAMDGLQERVRGLEAENTWRRETVAALEEAVRHLGEEKAVLEETIRRLGEEKAAVEDALEDAIRRFGEEKASIEGERQKATQAHDTLLVHHRDVLRQVIREVLAVSSLSVVQTRQARRRLIALAELLRAEAG